jgi:hypothetical protein
MSAGSILLGCTTLTRAVLMVAQQPDALTAAARSLDASSIRTLQFTGSGATVGQNATPDDPWPPVTVKSYTTRINYDTARMQLALVREMGVVIPRGGGVPFTGDVRQMQAISGRVAWNRPMPPNPAAGAIACHAVHAARSGWHTATSSARARQSRRLSARCSLREPSTLEAAGHDDCTISRHSHRRCRGDRRQAGITPASPR